MPSPSIAPGGVLYPGVSPPAGFVPVPRPDHKRRNTILVVVVIVGVCVLLAVSFLVVPTVPHSYSFVIRELSAPTGWKGSVNESFPVGAQVQGSWITLSGHVVNFTINSPGAGSIYSASGLGGMFSVRASSSLFSFTTFSSSGPQNTSVVGTYTTPLL